MIPIPVVMAALGRVPWRLVGYVVAALSLLLFAWRVTVWHDSHGRVKAMEKALATATEERDQCLVREEQAWEAVRNAEREAQEREATDREIAERIQHDLEAKLSAADRYGRHLAGRLQDHRARACARALSGAAGTSAGVPGAGGEPGSDAATGGAAELDAAEQAVYITCRKDAERLTAGQQWYQELRRSRGGEE